MSRPHIASSLETMLNILLIRTGTTEYEIQGRIQGVLDVPLCSLGRQEVVAAAEQIAQAGVAMLALYAGPSRSAQQTVALLQERLGVKAKTLADLRNLDHGLWQGMLVDEVRKKQPKVYRQWEEQPETVCPPEGETIREARCRLDKAVAKLHRKHKKGAIGMVAPEPLASLLASQLTEAELASLWEAVGARRSGPLWESIPVAQ